MKTARLFLILSLVALVGALAIVPATAQDDMSEFVFAHSGPIRPMDAHSHWYGSTHWMLRLYYDCLIGRAADGDGYDAEAAHSWEAVDDTTWRFHLREGNTFHNGEALDANAVKWNIDRVRHPIGDIPLYQQWAFVKEVIVVDDLTVDITTEKPHAYFEYDVSYNGCELIPPAYFEEVGQEEFNRNPGWLRPLHPGRVQRERPLRLPGLGRLSWRQSASRPRRLPGHPRAIGAGRRAARGPD